MTQLTTVDQPAPAEGRSYAEARLPVVSAGFFDAQSFQLMQRVAKGFASSTLVPLPFQGPSPEAIGNCMIALNLAQMIRANPLMVMQNLNIVQGRPTWSSKFLIATVNTCGRFTALRYEFFGKQGLDDWGCRAAAIEHASGEKLPGPEITIALAKKEGWFTRKGSKWPTMPEQMLRYRAAAWWTNVYAPEISMGLMTSEESQDIGDVRPSQNRQFVKVETETETETDADANEACTPQSRIDAFAENTDEEVVSASHAAVNAETGDASAPADDAETSRDAEAVSSNAPQPKMDEAASADRDDVQADPKLAEANAKGRAARKSGFTRQVPRNLQYKSKEDQARAFLDGWDEADRDLHESETQEGEESDGEVS